MRPRRHPSEGRTLSSPSVPAPVQTFWALAVAGFRRWATYRQAMVAGIFTNIVFGVMMCSVMRAAAASGRRPGGYDASQLTTFVWVGQGLLNVVWLWGWSELAERVRTGDVACDLLRPVDPLVAYAAADLGRFAQALLGRMVVPLAFGALFFDLHVPGHASTYPLFALSLVLAGAVSFASRYLVNLSAFWLLDVRGPLVVWMTASGALSGQFFPLRFLPGWAATLLGVATPFPSLFQTPLDIAVERTSVLAGLAHTAVQLAWAVALFVLCVRVQSRAVRRLTVQGG